MISEFEIGLFYACLFIVIIITAGLRCWEYDKWRVFNRVCSNDFINNFNNERSKMKPKRIEVLRIWQKKIKKEDFVRNVELKRSFTILIVILVRVLN